MPSEAVLDKAARLLAHLQAAESWYLAAIAPGSSALARYEAALAARKASEAEAEFEHAGVDDGE